MKTIIRKTMTYGVMPTKREYMRAWKEDGMTAFKFGNDPRVGDAELTDEELWDELKKAVKEYRNGSEKAGTWVSDVLFVLGFEWI